MTAGTTGTAARSRRGSRVVALEIFLSRKGTGAVVADGRLESSTVLCSPLVRQQHGARFTDRPFRIRDCPVRC